MVENQVARPFEKQAGSDNLYTASVQVFNSSSIQDVGLDLVYGNESLLFSIKLDYLPLNINTKPTTLDNSVSYMIYSYPVPKGIRYAIDIKPKIRAFRAFSLFSLKMERKFIVGMRTVQDTSPYSSGEVFDRYASIDFDQKAMNADLVVIKKLGIFTDDVAAYAKCFRYCICSIKIPNYIKSNYGVFLYQHWTLCIKGA